MKKELSHNSCLFNIFTAIKSKFSISVGLVSNELHIHHHTHIGFFLLSSNLLITIIPLLSLINNNYLDLSSRYYQDKGFSVKNTVASIFTNYLPNMTLLLVTECSNLYIIFLLVLFLLTMFIKHQLIYQVYGKLGYIHSHIFFYAIHHICITSIFYINVDYFSTDDTKKLESYSCFIGFQILICLLNVQFTTFFDNYYFQNNNHDILYKYDHSESSLYLKFRILIGIIYNININNITKLIIIGMIGFFTSVYSLYKITMYNLYQYPFIIKFKIIKYCIICGLSTICILNSIINIDLELVYISFCIILSFTVKLLFELMKRFNQNNISNQESINFHNIRNKSLYLISQFYSFRQLISQKKWSSNNDTKYTAATAQSLNTIYLLSIMKYHYNICILKGCSCKIQELKRQRVIAIIDGNILPYYLDNNILNNFTQMLLEKYLELCPDSVDLKLIAIRFYLKEVNLYNKGFLLIETLYDESKKLTLGQYIALHELNITYKNMLESENDAKNHNSLNIHNVIKYNENLCELKRLIVKQIKIIQNFWSLFLKENIVVGNIYNAARQIFKKDKHINFLYATAIQNIHYKVHLPHLIYALYVHGIQNQFIKANQYYNLYKKILERNKSYLKINELSNNTLFSDKNFYLIVSTNPKRLGAIIDCNETISESTGYSKTELINQPIEILIPYLLHASHQYYIMNYFETGQQTMFHRTRQLFYIEKSNNLRPCFIQLKQIQHIMHGNVLVGLIKPLESDHDYVLVNENGIIDSASKNFKIDMRIENVDLRNSNLNISIFCPKFKIINKCFTQVTRKQKSNQSNMNFIEDFMVSIPKKIIEVHAQYTLGEILNFKYFDNKNISKGDPLIILNKSINSEIYSLSFSKGMPNFSQKSFNHQKKNNYSYDSTKFNNLVKPKEIINDIYYKCIVHDELTKGFVILRIIQLTKLKNQGELKEIAKKFNKMKEVDSLKNDNIEDDDDENDNKALNSQFTSETIPIIPTEILHQEKNSLIYCKSIKSFFKKNQMNECEELHQENMISGLNDYYTAQWPKMNINQQEIRKKVELSSKLLRNSMSEIPSDIEINDNSNSRTKCNNSRSLPLLEKLSNSKQEPINQRDLLPKNQVFVKQISENDNDFHNLLSKTKKRSEYESNYKESLEISELSTSNIRSQKNKEYIVNAKKPSIWVFYVKLIFMIFFFFHSILGFCNFSCQANLRAESYQIINSLNYSFSRINHFINIVQKTIILNEIAQGFIPDDKYTNFNISSYSIYLLDQIKYNNNAFKQMDNNFSQIVSSTLSTQTQKGILNQVVQIIEWINDNNNDYNINYNNNIRNFTESKAIRLFISIVNTLVEQNATKIPSFLNNHKEIWFILRNGLNDLLLAIKQDIYRVKNDMMQNLSPFINMKYYFIILGFVITIALLVISSYFISKLTDHKFKPIYLIKTLSNHEISLLIKKLNTVSNYFDTIEKELIIHKLNKIISVIKSIDLDLKGKSPCAKVYKYDNSDKSTFQKRLDSKKVRTEIWKKIGIVSIIFNLVSILNTIPSFIISDFRDEFDILTNNLYFLNENLYNQELSITLAYLFIQNNTQGYALNTNISDALEYILDLQSNITGLARISTVVQKDVEISNYINNYISGDICITLTNPWQNRCHDYDGGISKRGLVGLNAYIYRTILLVREKFINSDRTYNDQQEICLDPGFNSLDILYDYIIRPAYDNISTIFNQFLFKRSAELHKINIILFFLILLTTGFSYFIFLLRLQQKLYDENIQIRFFFNLMPIELIKSKENFNNYWNYISKIR